MQRFDRTAIQRIAFHLIVYKNIRLKRALKTNRIDFESFFTLSEKELKAIRVPAAAIQSIKSGECFADADAEVEKINRASCELIFPEDSCYPSLLSQIYDPPECLYVMGNKEALTQTNIAVVGSRRATQYGYSVSRLILPPICRAGLAIVSGMAHGIDSLAHKIAINEMKTTIGVNGGGLNHLYPPGNRSLQKGIEKHGCIISEFPMDTSPLPFLFPIRNRIIAGISKSVLVVEAAVKSGSLITAKLALEQNRDIYAIPGRIDTPMSKGTNYLIKQGAKPVSSPSDILEDYGLDYENVLGGDERLQLSPKEKEILDMVPEDGLITVDYLVEKLSRSVPEIISVVMGMVLKNRLIEDSGGYRKIE